MSIDLIVVDIDKDYFVTTGRKILIWISYFIALQDVDEVFQLSTMCAAKLILLTDVCPPKIWVGL